MVFLDIHRDTSGHRLFHGKEASEKNRSRVTREGKVRWLVQEASVSTSCFC